MDFKSMFQETAPEEAGGFALIDVGTYEAELADCKLDMTKSPERLTIEYHITDGEYQGRKLWGNYNLEGRGIGFLKKDLGILGLDSSEVGSPEDIATLIWDAMPVPVVIYVAQKEWQGKMYNNVYLNGISDPPAATAPAPTNQKEATRRAQMTTGKTAPQPTGKTANGKTQPRPATKPAPKRGKISEPEFDDNDEIPF